MALFATLLVVIVSCSVKATDFDYSFGPNGPAHWGGICNSGRKQSPIKIDLDSTYSMSSEACSCRFTNYNVSDKYIIVKDNGHSIEVTMNDDSVRVSSVGLANEPYILSQFHFHWGETSGTGSEHWLNGKQYAMEMHLVHYNAFYANLTTASTRKHGIAVLAFLFEIHSQDNHDFDFLFNSLVNIPHVDDTYFLTHRPPVENMFRHVNRDLYVRYEGSLTTPGCYETVQWTVFVDPIPISEAQMSKIRAIKSDDGSTPIGHNFRPTQCLNDRIVYSSPLLSLFKK